jgi:uncharacterized membrane protein
LENKKMKNEEMKNDNITKQICLTGLFMAAICVATLFFKVSIPLGYAHLGNGFIFLACVFLGNPYGCIASGVGSALADLLGGFPQWILPTLIVKCLMGYLIGIIAEKGKIISLRSLIAVIIGTIEMVAGYTIAGAVLYGSMAAGLAQIPGLVAEDIVGIILFYIVGVAIEKSGVKKYVSQ